MYGIRFTVEYNDISFENFSVSDIAYLDFSGSGILTFDNFDNLVEKEYILDKEDFINIIIEDYFNDFDNYEDTIHVNQEDLDEVYNKYVKIYKEWH